MDSTIIAAIIGVLGTVLGAVVVYWFSRRRMSDKEIFWCWRVAFDRSAFRGPFIWKCDECKLREFKEAIEDAKRAVNTGIVLTTGNTVAEKGKGKAYIRNNAWRSKVDGIERRLHRISECAPVPGQMFDPEIERIMNEERDEIIKTLNDIWGRLGIPKLPIPTEVTDLAKDEHS